MRVEFDWTTLIIGSFLASVFAYAGLLGVIGLFYNVREWWERRRR